MVSAGDPRGVLQRTEHRLQLCRQSSGMVVAARITQLRNDLIMLVELLRSFGTRWATRLLRVADQVGNHIGVQETAMNNWSWR